MTAHAAAPPSLSLTATLAPIDAIDDALLGEWALLEQTSAFANPYYCSWFLPPLLHALGDPATVRLLLVRYLGALIGLAPVAFDTGYAKAPVRYLQSWKCDHIYSGAPLVRAGAETAFFEGLRSILARHEGGARFFRFRDITDMVESSARAAFAGDCVLTQKTAQRASLAAGRDFDAAYGDSFTGKKRKELRRQLRRLGETGAVDLVSTGDAAVIEDLAPEFLALEAAGWKSDAAHGFPLARSDREAGFFRDAMAAGARAGAVRASVLRIDRKPVAQLFSIRHGALLAAFKITYDEAFAAYSPGVHVLVEAMRDMLEDPSIEMFDSCARPGHPVAESLWRERMTMSDINIACRGADAAILKFCAGLENFKRSAARLARRSETEANDA